MKPVKFELERVSSVEEACELLADSTREVKVLAGGQSLVPLLNFRLARPDLLVDLNGLAELRYIRVEGGQLRVGAMTRQRDLERSAEVATGWPLLAESLQHVAHAPIRNRGTLGGSLAHADAAAELCTVALVLDAELVVKSKRGQRVIAIKDFFVGPFSTALEADEVLVEVRLPEVAAGTGWGFEEVARRKGDFAMVAVAALLRVESGKVEEARLAYASMGATPLRAYQAEAGLRGKPATVETFVEATEAAVEELSPSGDLHASRDYRLHVAKALTRRALESALTCARA